jgi:hypothetical protein
MAMRDAQPIQTASEQRTAQPLARISSDEHLRQPVSQLPRLLIQGLVNITEAKSSPDFYHKSKDFKEMISALGAMAVNALQCHKTAHGNDAGERHKISAEEEKTLGLAALFLSQLDNERICGQSKLFELSRPNIIYQAVEIALELLNSRENIVFKSSPILIAGLRLHAAGASSDGSLEHQHRSLFLSLSDSGAISPLTATLMSILIAEQPSFIKTIEPARLEQIQDSLWQERANLTASDSVTLGHMLQVAPLKEAVIENDSMLIEDILSSFESHYLLDDYLRLASLFLDPSARLLGGNNEWNDYAQEAGGRYYRLAQLINCAQSHETYEHIDQNLLIIKALTLLRCISSARTQIAEEHAETLLRAELSQQVAPILSKTTNSCLRKICADAPIFEATESSAIRHEYFAQVEIYTEVLNRFAANPHSRILKDILVDAVNKLGEQEEQDRSIDNVEVSRSPFKYALKKYLEKFIDTKRADIMTSEWTFEAIDEDYDATQIINGLKNITALEQLKKGSVQEINRVFGTYMFGRYNFKLLKSQLEYAQISLHRPINQDTPLLEGKPMFILLGGSDYNRAMRDAPNWHSYQKDAVFFEALTPAECLHAMLIYYRLWGPIQVCAVHMHGEIHRASPSNAHPITSLSIKGPVAKGALQRIIGDNCQFLVDICYAACSGDSIFKSLSQSLAGKGVKLVATSESTPISFIRRSPTELSARYVNEDGVDTTKIKIS